MEDLLLVEIGKTLKHLKHQALHLLHRKEHLLLEQLEQVVLHLLVKKIHAFRQDMYSITIYSSG